MLPMDLINTLENQYEIHGKLREIICLALETEP